jgi:hypothetical protein
MILLNGAAVLLFEMQIPIRFRSFLLGFALRARTPIRHFFLNCDEKLLQTTTPEVNRKFSSISRPAL